MTGRPPVFICSPYRGNVEENRRVAIALCRLAVLQNRAPFAPHLLYPAILDDADEVERAAGIECGLAFMRLCSEVWILDVEMSAGMVREYGHATSLGLPLRFVSMSELPFVAPEQMATRPPSI